MSEIRKLADDAQDLFKQICVECDRPQPHGHMGRVKSFMGQALEVLSRLAAEEEALSPAPQNTDQNERRLKVFEGWEWYDDKGSSVEYFKDRLVEAINKSPNYLDFSDALADYKRALAASPDPEGEWQWVPKGYVIAPEEPTNLMYQVGSSYSDYPSLTYRNMLTARPPVPKKGERT